jgi:hypothetical protein
MSPKRLTIPMSTTNRSAITRADESEMRPPGSLSVPVLQKCRPMAGVSVVFRPEAEPRYEI